MYSSTGSLEFLQSRVKVLQRSQDCRRRSHIDYSRAIAVRGHRPMQMDLSAFLPTRLKKKE